MNVNDNVSLSEELARYALNPVKPLKFRVFNGGAGKFGDPVAILDQPAEPVVNDNAAVPAWRWAQAAMI